MPTARVLISAALRRMGALSTGEVPSADEAQDGLDLLNDLLETWSLENLLVLAQTMTTKVLTASQQSYTVGSGGDIAIDWPVQIEHAALRVTTVTPVFDLPLRVLNAQDYAAISIKALTSTYPEAVWLQTLFPLATLWLYPVPTQANTLVLWTRGIVANWATLDTNVNLARGYRRAIINNLAVDLSPEHGRAVTPELAALALESKAVVKRSNTTPVYAVLDVPTGMAAAGGYNWRTDNA